MSGLPADDILSQLCDQLLVDYRLGRFRNYFIALDSQAVLQKKYISAASKSENYSGIEKEDFY